MDEIENPAPGGLLPERDHNVRIPRSPAHIDARAELRVDSAQILWTQADLPKIAFACDPIAAGWACNVAADVLGNKRALACARTLRNDDAR